MRHTQKSLNEYATTMGLGVTYYNPGDNPQYRVVSDPDKDYFTVSRNHIKFQTNKASEVFSFLSGWDRAMDTYVPVTRHKRGPEANHRG